jgi:hypothetical protein
MILGYELGRCILLRLQSFSEKEKGFSPTSGAGSLGVSVYFLFHCGNGLWFNGNHLILCQSSRRTDIPNQLLNVQVIQLLTTS